jgi:hypothetical protein
MICRGCGKEIVDGEEYRMVAAWPFCLSCFEGLMKGPGKTDADRPPEQLQARPAAADAGPKAPRCAVCKKELEPGEHKKLGIWTFCSGCYQELVTIPNAEVVEAEDTGHNKADAGEADAQAEGKEALIARVSVGLAAYVQCKGCGRRIPQGGARIVNGEAFCPDCYYAMPAEEETESVQTLLEAPQPPSKTDLPDRDETHGAEDRCACCDRPLRTGFFSEVDGFTLCRACLSTDAELAVQIARQRHRKLLGRLRNELDTPKT